MAARRTRPTAILAVAALLALPACGDDDPTGDEPATLEASPLTETPTPAASPEPSPDASPASPTPTPSPTVRAATDTDRARFVAGYRPEGASDVEHVAVDLEGDDTDELVFAYVSANGTSRVDVAWWDGTRYVIEYRAEGTRAQRVDRLRVADVNGDGITEIATLQSSGTGSSLSLWQVVGEHALSGLRARGGCADGLHTYGVVGAELEDRDGDGRDEIYATCDDSPLPVAAWHTDTYVWQDGAYRVAPAQDGDDADDGGDADEDDGDGDDGDDDGEGGEAAG